MKSGPGSRTFRVFRYDPTRGGTGHYVSYSLVIDDDNTTTVLDALLRIQREKDPSLSFRYACRVGMCGSCAMVINGQESLACKTILSRLRGREITVRPLNHFPVVKDLIVELEPFFESLNKALPFFEPSGTSQEPALIRPDSRERRLIGMATECIACGCCLSSCTMMSRHSDYVGPAALNRAFTLLADSRDGLHDERLGKVIHSCTYCRTELNCTEVCPKQISPTSAIKYIQRHSLGSKQKPAAFQKKTADRAAIQKAGKEAPKGLTRAGFLGRAAFATAAASCIFLGVLAAAAAVAPSMKRRERRWVKVGEMETFPPGSIKNVMIRYETREGFYRSRIIKPVLVSRSRDSTGLVVFNSRCTHLGCTVHWDQKKRLFLCACHGGAFYPDGRVKSGPPPRPLDRYLTRIRNNEIFILEG